MPADRLMLPRLSFSYDQWLRDTSRTMQVRSANLKALDILVDTYIRVPSPNNLTFLRRGFEQWKDSKGDGDAWRASSRNMKADGFNRLEADLKGTGDSDATYGLPDFMSEGMTNARLGMLYLFANLRCDTGHFSIITSGILDLTGASLDFAESKVEDKNLSYANKAFGALKDQIAGQSERVDKWLRIRKETRRVVTSDQLQTGAPRASGANLAAQQQISDSLQRAAKEIARSIDLTPKASDPIPNPNPRTAPEQSWLGEKLWEYSPVGLRQVCDYLGGKYLADAMPFIGGGLATLGGLIDAVSAGTARYIEFAHGRHVNILSGHPSTIVNEIRRAMDISVCAGLYKTLKGGAKLTVEGVTAGAASPVSSLVFSVVEALVSTTWKIYDIRRMGQFFAEARLQYALREQPSALHTRPMAFNAWYRSYALGTPVLSVLALNSRICGDKMRFLKMYTASNQVVTQSEFDAGVRYVDELQIWGEKYLSEVGYKFDSDDPLTKGLLNPVHPHPEREGFFQKRVLGSVKGFIG
ncbi:MAG: hypothetical protein GAK28_00659 [Luteibacter sp.]|uniref:hypothetical protein n=1 Tax=Luteibacter sp. TaxID=1886636 RepID=UPI001380DC61|nr:hypothetical protein [Luteibacter sp.]KAF1009026.1 MAG: hypothetical protein GAK28_00659 [Luteibacter sp.]